MFRATLCGAMKNSAKTATLMIHSTTMPDSSRSSEQPRSQQACLGPGQAHAAGVSAGRARPGPGAAALLRRIAA